MKVNDKYMMSHGELKHIQCVAEVVINKSQRLMFDVSSPNGILLFREISKLLCDYGQQSLLSTHVILHVLCYIGGCRCHVYYTSKQWTWPLPLYNNIEVIRWQLLRIAYLCSSLQVNNLTVLVGNYIWNCFENMYLHFDQKLKL